MIHNAGDADKPDKAFRRSRSFRGDQGLVGKTRMVSQPIQNLLISLSNVSTPNWK